MNCSISVVQPLDALSSCPIEEAYKESPFIIDKRMSAATVKTIASGCWKKHEEKTHPTTHVPHLLEFFCLFSDIRYTHSYSKCWKIRSRTTKESLFLHWVLTFSNTPLPSPPLSPISPYKQLPYFLFLVLIRSVLPTHCHVTLWKRWEEGEGTYGMPKFFMKERRGGGGDVRNA